MAQVHVAEAFRLLQDCLHLGRHPRVRKGDVDEAGMGHIDRANEVRAVHAGHNFLGNLDWGHASQASHTQTNGRCVVAVCLILGPL